MKNQEFQLIKKLGPRKETGELLARVIVLHYPQFLNSTLIGLIA